MRASLASMPDADRRRLGLILARLASSHEGEVLNAVRLALRELAKHGLRPECLAQLAKEDPQQRQHRSGRYQPPPDEQGEIHNAADFAEWLMEFAVGLTEREHSFLNNLSATLWRTPTPKQADWLRAIARKVPFDAPRYGT